MQKILIANRGEIALRIMRTARKMGLKTVAVYSEADRDAPHVRFADEAVCIGPAPSSQSYLQGQRIIHEAMRFDADAIHPGYGFLSENAEFAQAVQESGLIFIGPSPASIDMMGSKLAAKAAVKQYNIPLVPGIDEAIADIEKARRIAQEVGYPVLIKASAGGGGKGMRIVEQESELREQMQRAVSEAESAFGNGAVFIEKYIGSPRHIEIQVLADQHGRVVHLFERECSIQRRHQKVIEEAPSVIVTPEIRAAMGKAAVQVAKACNYTGAGTVEFLMDENLQFYFLEMNTRLQVEHPVTEMITGIDLVEQQIRVARGEALGFTQNDIRLQGHAIELRIYAEDPLNNFLPSVGTLERYSRPSGKGIRLDDGYEEGMAIPIHYDPLIAKLITFGPDRPAAIRKMLEAIAAFQIEGVQTTLPFGQYVLEHEAFLSGGFDTHFVQNHFSADKIRQNKSRDALVAALAGVKMYLEKRKHLKAVNGMASNWKIRLKL